MRRRDKPVDIHRKLDLLRVPISSSPVPILTTNAGTSTVVAAATTAIESSGPEGPENVSN